MRILTCILLAHLFYWSYLFIFIVFFAKGQAPGFKEHLAHLTASEHIISWSDEGIVWGLERTWSFIQCLQRDLLWAQSRCVALTLFSIWRLD